MGSAARILHAAPLLHGHRSDIGPDYTSVWCVVWDHGSPAPLTPLSPVVGGPYEISLKVSYGWMGGDHLTEKNK